MASNSGLDLSVCTSYKEFNEKLEYHRRNSKQLNDLPEHKRPDKDACSQQFRDSFVEIVATWKKYVQKILKEAVETVFEIMLDADSAQAVLASTQGSKKLLQRAMVHHAETTSTHESSTVEPSVDLISQPDLWKRLLATFKDSQLKKCDHIVRPLFHGENGIDKKFMSLFDTSTCLSDIIIEMGPVRLTYMYSVDCSQNSVPMVIDSSQSLNDILRLHYGASCVFSHTSQTNKISQPGGALHNFPTKAEFQQQIGEEPGDYLYILYNYIQKYGSEAWIYYPNLINLQRILKAVAFRLFTAISKWVYDEFGKCIWNFDPTKCYGEHLKDDLPVQPDPENF